MAVIEAGGFYELDNGNVSQIPAYETQYSSPDPSSIQPTVDWGIVTAPQTACLLIGKSEILRVNLADVVANSSWAGVRSTTLRASV